MITLLAYGLLILPSLALAYYVAVFGVSVVVWDEREMVPLIEKMMSHSLTFSDLFVQCNEHRIPFARAAMLAIAVVTRFNTMAEMFFSCVLIFLTELLVFYVYKKTSLWSNDPKLLLFFLPVSVLLHSFGQFESILLGFCNHVYLMVFSAVATFCQLRSLVSRLLPLWP